MQKRLKITLILMPIAAVTVVGVYISSLWASERQRTAEAPVEAFDVMVRDLRSFHKKRGGFPKDLKELEGVVWEKKEGREFSKGGSGLTHRNYHYLYTPISHHQFALWAIPVGRQREEAATWFLVITPESRERSFSALARLPCGMTATSCKCPARPPARACSRPFGWQWNATGAASPSTAPPSSRRRSSVPPSIHNYPSRLPIRPLKAGVRRF